MGNGGSKKASTTTKAPAHGQGTLLAQPVADPQSAAKRINLAEKQDSHDTQTGASESGNEALFFERPRVLSSHLCTRFEKNYTVQSKLGEGLYGTVLKATTTTKQTLGEDEIRFVAAKRFQCKEEGVEKDQSAALSKLKREFEQERSVLSLVQHPHIIKMYEAFEEQKRFWIVLEYCPGGELHDFIADNPKGKGKLGLREDLVRLFFKQMLYAFSYLQGKLIVHRDVKPNNFLLLGKRGSEDAHVLKLCDFDTAVQLLNLRSRAMGNVGTRSYSAPEVHASKGASLKSDDWSLGVNLYCMLIGLHPFRWSADDSEEDVIQRIKGASEHKDCDEWRGLKSEDRAFIDLFLLADEKARVAAKDALWHSWLLEPEPPEKITSYKDHAGELLKRISHFVSLDFMQKLVLSLCAQMMPESRIRDAKLPWYRMFLALDKNRDGVLDYEELTKGLRDLLGSKAPSDQDLKRLVRGLDLKNSGAVDWVEWAALAVVSMREVASAEEPLCTVFRLLDRPSGDGKINERDILEIILSSDAAIGTGGVERLQVARILRPPGRGRRSSGRQSTADRWEIELEGGWKPYDEDVTELLNTAKAQGQNKVSYSARGQTYKIDLETLVQANTRTGVARKVRCAAADPTSGGSVDASPPLSLEDLRKLVETATMASR
jgi:serine/threonine protein kinase